MRRLVVQSSLGVGPSARHVPPVLRVLVRLALASALADHATQEEVVRGSGLEWTVVRPTGLKDTPARGSRRAVEDSQEGRLGGTVPRADLAAFVLGLLEDPGSVARPSRSAPDRGEHLGGARPCVTPVC